MSGFVVLTGATGHLGRAMLTSLVEHWTVICIVRNVSKLEPLIKKFSDRVLIVESDFTVVEPSVVVEQIEVLVNRFNTNICGLVNNACF